MCKINPKYVQTEKEFEKSLDELDKAVRRYIDRLSKEEKEKQKKTIKAYLKAREEHVKNRELKKKQ